MTEALEAVIRTLLAPPDGSPVESWQAAVADAAIDAARAQFAVFLLPPAGLVTAATAAGRAPPLDRIRAILERDPGQGVWIEAGAAGHDVVLAAGGDSDPPSLLALLYDSDAGAADAAAELLRTLEPAFRAGVRLRLEARARSGAVARALDRVPGPVLLCDDGGRAIHANSALAEHPGRAELQGRMEYLARSLARTYDAGTPARDDILESEARVGGEVFRLRASRIADSGADGMAGILLTVDSGRADGTGEDTVPGRFGLTERQAETAKLLAAGRSNAEIAERLGLSPFTVQKHVRAVLRKLDVPSRSAVGAALRGADGTDT